MGRRRDPPHGRAAQHVNVVVSSGGVLSSYESEEAHLHRAIAASRATAVSEEDELTKAISASKASAEEDEAFASALECSKAMNDSYLCESCLTCMSTSTAATSVARSPLSADSVSSTGLCLGVSPLIIEKEREEFALILRASALVAEAEEYMFAQFADSSIDSEPYSAIDSVVAKTVPVPPLQVKGDSSIAEALLKRVQEVSSFIPASQSDVSATKNFAPTQIVTDSGGSDSAWTVILGHSSGECEWDFCE